MARKIIIMLGGLLTAWTVLSAAPAQALDDSRICGAQTIREERASGIPDRLLHAISLVESGRWNDQRRETIAWPWTIMAEGQGRFLPSKADAIAEVRKLQARGVRNIDVGCMQVNLQAHPDAFATLDEAFDPASNVAYAARFLMGLYQSTHNWATAGAYYHSQTPSEAAPYKAKLLTTWNAMKSHGEDRLQLAAFSSRDNQPPMGLYMPAVAQTAFREPAPARPAPRLHGVTVQPSKTDERSIAERAEAKRIADAYRKARIAEYEMHKAQLAAKG